MFLPVVLCGSVRTAAFSPTQLSGYVNSPYNIALLRSQGKLWQDTAMTVPAVADGDPVRRIDCNGTYYDAPSDASRPLLWDEGGGKWSLSFDGVDDQLAVASLHAGPASFSQFGCVLKTGSTTAGCYIFGATESNASSHDLLSYVNDNGVYFYVTNASNSTVSTGGPPTLTSAWTRVGGAYDGATITAYQNGSAYGTPASQTGNIRQTSPLRLSNGYYGFPGRMVGVVFVNSALSATERTNLDTYLAALAPSTPPFPENLTGYVDSPYNIALLRLHGNLWQDTTFTTRATADGDPVRRIVCGSTYYDAPSDAARPLLWDEGGGKWSLFLDGIDDRLVAACPVALAAVTLALRLRLEAVGYYQMPVSVSSERYISVDDGTHNARCTTDNGVSSAAPNPAVPVAGYATLIAACGSGGVSTEVYLGGVQVAQDAADSTSSVSGATISIGNYMWGGYPFGGRIAGFTLIARKATTDEVALLDTYLSALAP